MISILIPIYNFDVNNLVKDLVKQCQNLQLNFEVRCYDDCSETDWLNKNEGIQSMPNVVYKLLSQNLGRSKIRNILSQEALYDTQLFMDCDSEVLHDDYIEKFWNNRHLAPVIFGGRVYSAQKPKDNNKILRWKYGTKREVIAYQERKKNPYLYFMTNNFLVSRKVIERVPFQEDLEGYGHEDTLFAQDLKRNKLKIEHIDNPLCHIGLENATEFLDKTHNGVKNLVQLVKTGLVDDENKLYRTYIKMNKYGLISAFKVLFFFIELPIKKNLVSGKPLLFLFDVFKLNLFIRMINNHV